MNRKVVYYVVIALLLVGFALVNVYLAQNGDRIGWVGSFIFVGILTLVRTFFKLYGQARVTIL